MTPDGRSAGQIAVRIEVSVWQEEVEHAVSGDQIKWTDGYFQVTQLDQIATTLDE